MTFLRRRTVLSAAATACGALAATRQARPETAVMRPLTDITRIDPPKTLPAVSFVDLQGTRKTLADFSGRPVLLNFWATWCVPCVAELPELDRLAASPDFFVVAVSADRGGAPTVKPFLAAHGITHATILLDPGLAAANALGAAGFPTSFILDAKARLRGQLEGPAGWGNAAETIKRLTA